MNTQHGFTLVELMYTVAIAAIIMSVGVPTFSATVRNSSMTATANSIVTAMHSARSEAIKRRTRLTVCPAQLVAGAASCQADGSSLLVFTNVDDDATYDEAAGDVMIQFQEWMRGDITTVTNTLPGYISYTPAGFTRAIGGGPIAGDLVFCDMRGNSSARVLSVSATGRPQIRMHKDAPTAPSCGS